MTANPVVSSPGKASPGQRLKLTGTGFRAGTKVRIVFYLPRRVVGSTVARPDGTFRTSIVVPRSRPGSHKLQVLGTAQTGQPASVAEPVMILATDDRVAGSPSGDIDEPVMLTLSVVLPLATWLGLEILGWRTRRHSKRPTTLA